MIELLDSNLTPTDPNMERNIINPNINFDAFTIAHEIGHAWNFQNNKVYERNIEWRTGGTTNPIYQFMPQCWNDTEHRLPGCNNAGYYFGGTPLYGGGSNFNISEDFANSVAVYMFPSKSQDIVNERYNDNDPNSQWYKYYRYNPYYYWTLDQLEDNPRWIYINELINGGNQP
jgi:hypothetical protein